MNELIGSQISHYRIDALLGDGGMGTVYRATDINLGRTVAIKVMHPHIARRQEFRERLKKEARTAANLDHPSIVKVFDFSDKPFLYIVMEYIPGDDLGKHLASRGQRGLPFSVVVIG